MFFLSGTGGSSSVQPDMRTASVRLLRDGKFETIAVLFTNNRALTTYETSGSKKKNFQTGYFTIEVMNFSEFTMRSTHRVDKIIEEKSNLYSVDLAVIVVSCKQTPRLRTRIIWNTFYSKIFENDPITDAFNKTKIEMIILFPTISFHYCDIV